MKKILLLLALAALAASPVSAQDWAKAILAKSSRHGEWVTVTNGSRAVQCWVVYPEVKDKATAVVVIHEIFGLTDWARNAADEVAAAGYIAIAPDLLSGLGTNHGGSQELGEQGSTRVIGSLPPDQITGDLNAAADYVKALPAANGKVEVAGFCWGGSQSFRFACNRPDLKAAYVFYGMAQPAAAMAKIQCPVYGFYGEMDGRSALTSQETLTQMKAAGKTYEPVVYAGAGHGFMRAGENPDDQPNNAAMKAANKKAHDDAWVRWKDLLKKIN